MSSFMPFGGSLTTTFTSLLFFSSQSLSAPPTNPQPIIPTVIILNFLIATHFVRAHYTISLVCVAIAFWDSQTAKRLVKQYAQSPMAENLCAAIMHLARKVES
jgi:hypothetical protein